MGEGGEGVLAKISKAGATRARAAPLPRYRLQCHDCDANPNSSALLLGFYPEWGPGGHIFRFSQLECGGVR